MTFKIKQLALVMALIITLCTACGCADSKDTASDEATVSSSENEIMSDTEDGEKEQLSEIEQPTTEFEDTKFEKYKYVWGDEFEKDELDLSKWIVQMHSSESTDSLQFETGDEELPNVFRVKDGVATQNVVRWYDPTNTLIQYAKSAHLMTRPTMSYQYGYLEVRLRMSFRKDANSIWLASNNALNSNKNSYCNIEIDVFETLASTDSLTPNIHYWYSDGRHTDYNGYALKGEPQKYTFKESYNLSNEFHIYGFEWTPTEMSMYVDGEKYWTLDTTKSFDNDPDTSVYNQPIYLMLHGGAFTNGSTWHTYSGDEINNSSLPLDYSIDYVRLYQDPDMAGTQLNLAN